MRLGSRSAALAFVAPSLMCLAGVIGYPLFQAAATSLYRWNLISGSQRWAGVQNFIDILEDPDTLQVAVVTLIYTLLAVAIELLTNKGLGDKTYAAAEKAMGLESLVAVVAATGSFSMTCMTANSFGIEPPADNPTPLAQ